MSTRDAVRGNRLSDAGVRDLLTEVGHGVLALPGDGPPYPLPMSFGFDGSDRLYR
jgi:nitroimidazol reductase NimA-like FMN-containing flavoprotein (pyridoxamine 5'-phosphate oxidase superfamily)